MCQHKIVDCSKCGTPSFPWDFPKTGKICKTCVRSAARLRVNNWRNNNRKRFNEYQRKKYHESKQSN